MQAKENRLPHIECEEDRISLLPDCLLIEIISRLPCTKQAIKTGTLSKRWKNLWTEVHNLIFVRHSNEQRIPELFSYIENVLRQRVQSNLNKFHLDIPYSNGIDKQVNNLIRYAFSCNVQDLEIGTYNAVILDHFFYINSSFTHMKLKRCVFNPTGAISWTNLKSLCIESGHVYESLIENILSGSPLLETLKLKDCGGFCRIDITSKSVKNLVFSGYVNEWDDVDIDTRFNFKIYAPHILSLTIEEEFPSFSEVTLLNVSYLVEATINYCENNDFWRCDYSWFYEPKSQEEKGEMLKDLILSLCHVKRLKIEGYCLETLARLKAKGFTFPSNMGHPILPAYVSSESEDCSENYSTEYED